MLLRHFFFELANKKVHVQIEDAPRALLAVGPTQLAVFRIVVRSDFELFHASNLNTHVHFEQKENKEEQQ